MRNAKIFLILFVAICMVALIACGGDKCKGKLAGKWVLKDKTSKKDFSIDFKEIGKFTSDVDGEDKSGQWTIVECKEGQSAKVKMGDKEVEIKFSGANSIELVYGKVATPRKFQSAGKE